MQMVLTEAQRRYLTVIAERGRLHYGWGGYRSTAVVRRLHELGLVNLREWGRPGDWVAQITDKGAAVEDDADPFAGIVDVGVNDGWDH